MSDSGSERGYSMSELLLVLCLVSIIAAVAYPSLLRARTASIETSMVGALRTILGAQAVYAATCGGGFYAPSLDWLTRGGGSGRDAFLGPEFTGDIVDRSGYRLRFTPATPAPSPTRSCNGVEPGHGIREYFVAADPIDMTGPSAEGRHYGANSSGVIFESPKRVRLTLTGTPGSPARPLH